jgi:hypothetical protein
MGRGEGGEWVRGQDHEYGRMMYLLDYTIMVLGRLVGHAQTRYTEHETAANSKRITKGWMSAVSAVMGCISTNCQQRLQAILLTPEKNTLTPDII